MKVKVYKINSDLRSLLILTGAVIGFLSEVYLMFNKMKVELADLLLLLFTLRLWV